MLPFDKKPWAKKLAATVIAVTLFAAVVVPLVLVQRKALDLSMVVGIVLLVLAIVPPNIMVLRQRRVEDDRHDTTMVPSHSSVR